jgi:hypothetical protein
MAPGSDVSAARIEALRVWKGDVICGVPAPTARELMRAYRLDRPTGVACGVLGLDRGSAEQQMQSFEAAGYVQRSTRVRGADDAWWVTTIKGNALAQASFGRPISRAAPDGKPGREQRR